MGAFGRLLQQHFGSTIHDVKTWDKSKSVCANTKCLKCHTKLVTLIFNPNIGWLCEKCTNDLDNFLKSKTL